MNKTLSTTANYSIKDLEILTNIKSHTIRIWEKRYAILKPNRTQTNIRQYDNDDLTKLLNVTLLNKQGYKISKIAAMSDVEVKQLILDGISSVDDDEIISSLIVGMIELDEVQLNIAIEKSNVVNGFENTITNVIFPFFHRIGLMWQAGAINPAQEHFVSHLVRQKIIAATDKLPYLQNDKMPKVLLFLPENELHELALLFYNYALRARNCITIYLSQAVPVQDLDRILEIANPDAIVCTITNALSDLEMQNILKPLSNATSCAVFLSGPIIKSYSEKLAANISTFENLSELLERLDLKYSS